MAPSLLAALILAGGLAAPGPARAAAAAKRPVCAVVTDVEGEPRLIAVGAPPVPLRVGQFLYQNDVVVTGKGDKAAVALLAGVEIRLNGNTRFEAGDGGGPHGPGVVRLKVGQIWSRVLHKKAGLEVETAMGLAAIRGTEADVALTDRLTVKVYEGRVDLSNAGVVQALSAGYASEVLSADAPPEPARPLRGGERGSWQEEVRPLRPEAQLERLQGAAEDEQFLEIETGVGEGRRKIRLKLRRKPGATPAAP